jgi:5'-AMP-activated protein kinase catalytic alpha subunit
MSESLHGEPKGKFEVIGNYILGEDLGSGTFGVVRKARHIHSGESVAVKRLEKAKVLDLSDSERINRELHIIKLMRHPYVVDLYEVE